MWFAAIWILPLRLPWKLGAGAVQPALTEYRYPDHCAGALAALSGATCRLVSDNDGTLSGAWLEVDEAGHAPIHDHEHRHGHVHWSDIHTRLASSDRPAAARDHALGIFTVLAEAEARVHGVAVEDVAFHEVGAADSVADIVAAAWVVVALSPASWSVAPLPLGS